MDSFLPVIFIGSATLVCTYLLTYFIRKYAIKKALIDFPGDRTSHDTPTPRGGGIAFVATWIILLLGGLFTGYLDKELTVSLLPASLLIALLGFLDDHYDLSLILRLFIQIIAAAIFLYSIYNMDGLAFKSGVSHPNHVRLFLEMLAIVWSINLFNFMDGIDTLASAEAIFIFLIGGIFILLFTGGVEGFLAIILSFSIFGFLLWNLPPAKIFMGDGGSNFLGFMVPAFALICEKKYGMPIVIWVILYGAFWFDALLTLIRRMIKKEKWYLPHKLHAYQRLHQSGMSHGRVTLIYLSVNIVLAAIAYVGFAWLNSIYISLVVSIFILSALYFTVENLTPSSK